MKKTVVYLMLLMFVGALGVINYYLLQIQTDKQQRIRDLQAQVQLHLRQNKLLNDRNDTLRVEVDTLRSPNSYYSYEEKAREDYGLIGANETFFVLPKKDIQAIADVDGLLKIRRAEQDDDRLVASTGSTFSLPQNVPLLQLESIGKTENDPEKENGGNVPSIPVSPVPLQLESLH